MCYFTVKFEMLTRLSTTIQVNIFVASQRGEVQTIKALIESGKAKATDRDDQNVTPLHWAAINAQLPACRYLLEQGLSPIICLGSRSRPHDLLE